MRNTTYDIILTPVVVKHDDTIEFGYTMPISRTW